MDTNQGIDHGPFSASSSHAVGILVIHGFTGSPHSMRPVAEFFAQQGYNVEMPLLPGHGTQWQDMLQTSHRDWSQEVCRAYDRLAESCEKIFLIGLSMGGALAIQLGAQVPVAGIVLINPYVVDPKLSMAFARYLHPVLPSLASIGSDIAKQGVQEGSYDATPVKAVAQLHELGKDVRACVPRLSAPVLYFRSVNDHVVSDKSHKYFQKKAQCPVTFRWLVNSFHVATLDYDAQRILEESLTFLNENS